MLSVLGEQELRDWDWLTVGCREILWIITWIGEHRCPRAELG